MRETDGSEPLLAALDELAALGTPEDGAALDELRARLCERRLRVLVAGEAKRGKSSLVNALLGQAVLPAGVTPLTAVATTVRYGPRTRSPKCQPTVPSGSVSRSRSRPPNGWCATSTGVAASGSTTSNW